MSDGRQDVYQDFMRAKDAVGLTPCESNPDAFFPEDYDERVVQNEQRRIAKALCAECPIKVQCLDYAMATNEVYGIWGGLSYQQRSQLRRGKR